MKYLSKEEGAAIKKCEHCYAKVDFDGSILFGHYFAFCFPCRINVKLVHKRNALRLSIYDSLFAQIFSI